MRGGDLRSVITYYTSDFQSHLPLSGFIKVPQSSL